MAALLAKAGPGLTVQTLLDTLQQTMEFEASIAKKFATPVRHLCLAVRPRIADMFVHAR